MKSFKKIALVLVAAMTTGTLVSTPASANTLGVVATTWNAAKAGGADWDTPATAGTALGTAITRPVPEDNKIDNVDVVRFVATVAAGTSVTASATNATVVAALDSVASPVTASSGSASLTIATGTGTTATFFVYTKTTAVGTVVFTNGVNTTTFFLQGTVGKINTLSVSAPANGASGTKQDVVVTATDVFGNRVSGRSITATVFAATGTLDTSTVTTGATLADFGQATFKVTLPATGFTRTLVTFTPTNSSDAVSAAVVGLSAPVLAPFAEIAIRDMAAELARVQADLAAERAGRAADKAAADAAAATAKAAADAAALKAAADLVTANAEIAKLKAEAVTAKAAADKALADAIAKASADAAVAKAASDKAIADLKRAFNKLARSWNKKNPTARVALVK